MKSQNQHGLHSPFVYDFVTQGLYKKRVKNGVFTKQKEFKNLSKKQLKILSKIVSYFKIDTISVDLNSFKNSREISYKILYFKNLSQFKNIDFNILTSKHIILIDRMYQNKKSYQNWQDIIKNKDATVTLDLFYFGLIFFRKEQAKEHFIIRS